MSPNAKIRENPLDLAIAFWKTHMYAPVRNDFLTIQLAVFYKAYTEKVLNSSFFLL